jgi:hypothetical protein
MINASAGQSDIQHHTHSRFTSGTAFPHFPFLHNWAAMLLFFPFIIFPTETGAKNKQAPSTASGKRKCDDTNSIYEHTNPTNNNQTQYLFATGSGFCEFSFILFCCFTAAWRRTGHT